MKIEHVLLASCVVFSLPNLTQNREKKKILSHFQSKKIFRHTFKAKRYFVTLSKQKEILSHFQSKIIIFVTLSKQKEISSLLQSKKRLKKTLQSRSLNLLHHTCTHHRYMNLILVVLSISNLILSGYL